MLLAHGYMEHKGNLKIVADKKCRKVHNMNLQNPLSILSP